MRGERVEDDGNGKMEEKDWFKRFRHRTGATASLDYYQMNMALYCSSN